eukprot:TRINITY_DN41554_c0_g1_i1.p1 TRINITY_DN41554_c0_g1~~TRINITY_DN41554_c0_g1_i1.p1  ORF type:complete len:384 (-),score=107.56 TRINITY_DN41554_c0_g1_i1:39-1034(-)
MHKIFGLECGQVNFDESMASWASDLAGLQEGSCESSGYTESKGSREVELPLVGLVRMEVFRKPDLLGLAMQVGSQLGGKAAVRDSACCTVCSGSEEKYRSLDRAKGECKEACLSFAKKSLLSFSGFLDDSFQLAQTGSCAELGFPVLNSTQMKGVEPAGFTWDLYSQQPAGTKTLRKVAVGICGQVTLGKADAENAKLLELLSLEEGSCAGAGYSEGAGDQFIEGLGGKKFQLFRKAGDLDVVDFFHMAFSALTQDTVTLHRKIGGDLCSEAVVDKKLKGAVEQVGGFSSGRCQDLGFSSPAGSQSLSLPLGPSVELALFKRADVSAGFQI